MKGYLKQLFDFRRLLRPESIKMLNILLLLSITLLGLVQFYLRDAPPERSVYLSIGATIILVLYLRFVSKRRQKYRK